MSFSQGTVTQRYPMSGFYASKIEEVAADGRAHNEAMMTRFPTHEDRVRALNANVVFGLTGAVPEVSGYNSMVASLVRCA